MFSNPEDDHIQAEPEVVKTPVALPEVGATAAPFPLAHLPAELSARQSLESWQPGGTVAAEIEKTIGELSLPATLAGALALLREVSRLTPADKVGLKTKAATLKAIRAHIHRLSQGPTPPKINHAQFLKRTPHPAALAHIQTMYPTTTKTKRR